MTYNLHVPGCPVNRGRDCLCAYLESWSSPKPAVYWVDDPSAPITNEVRRAMQLSGVVATDGAGILLMPKSLLRQKPDTPQNRDAARRAGLTQDLDHRIGLLQDSTREALEHCGKLAQRVLPRGPLARSVRKYLADHPEVRWKQRAEYWEHRAGFFKTGLYYALSCLAVAVTGLAVIGGELAGWW
ncbi:membrane protein [Arthrobacter phage Rizwana]|nr:membrane protein [Arthrobacter phage Rizwana]